MRAVHAPDVQLDCVYISLRLLVIPEATHRILQARTQACFQVARKPHQEVGVTFTVSASVEV